MHDTRCSLGNPQRWVQPPGQGLGAPPAEPRLSVPWEPRADPQVGRALHEQYFTIPAETRAADRDLLPHSHGTSPRPGSVTQSPTVASSPRPLIQTLIISAYISLQTTSCLCFSFSALILRRVADFASPQLPPAGRGSAAGAAQPPRERSASPGHRGAPLRDRAAPPAPPWLAAPRAAAKRRKNCTSPNLPAELLLLGELFTSQGRAALQGKVHPRWECFAGEVIYSLQGR